MSRLPPALQPIWPLAKRAHRLLSLVLGLLGRRLSLLWGDRRLPRTATATSAQTAAREPDAVRLHPGPAVPPIRRTPPEGDPPGHWTFRDATAVDLPPRSTLEIRDGLVVGDYAAIITPGHVLDFETSEYFGIAGWREHPLFLRPRLPPVEVRSGSMLVLAARGGASNYYHFLMDVLPRLSTLEECCPGVVPDTICVPARTSYQQQLLALAGLDARPRVDTRPDLTLRAERLLVPSLPNPREVAPGWVVEWLRKRFPPGDLTGKPSRIYVTRGSGPRTRRLDGEAEVWPELERRGFVRIDPGTMSVRDQIDHFAAAEVVVGLHGAALTNLVFLPAGARVLHLFAPRYVKHCFWAIVDEIPGTVYRYLVGEGRGPGPRDGMQGIQDDVRIAPDRLLHEVDRLLS